MAGDYFDEDPGPDEEYPPSSGSFGRRAREPDEPPVRYENTTCVKLARSGKAILCQIPELEQEVWFPLSQVDADSEVFDDGEHASGTLIVSHWIAKEKGLVK